LAFIIGIYHDARSSECQILLLVILRQGTITLSEMGACLSICDGVEELRKPLFALLM